MNHILLSVLFICTLAHYVRSQCSTDQECVGQLGVHSVCTINYCHCKYGYTPTVNSCVPNGSVNEGNNEELNTAKISKFAIAVGAGVIVIIAVVAFCFYKRRQSAQRSLNV